MATEMRRRSEKRYSAISALELSHFKNFRHALLPLADLTLLVGTNASGKSNLRDAFRFIHGISRGYTLAETLGEKWVEGGSLQWKGIRGGTREAIYPAEDTFTLATTIRSRGFVAFRHSISVQIEQRTSAPRVVRESLWRGLLTFDGAQRWRPSRMIYDSHPDEDPPAQKEPQFICVRLPRGGRHRRLGKRLQFVSSQPVLSQIADHPNVTPTVRAHVLLVLQEMRSMQFLDLSPDAMRIPSVPGQDVLGDRGENLSSVLQSICADKALKRAILEWIGELTPLDVVDFEFVPDQTGRVLVSLVEADRRSTSAYSASDGTLRFLAMIAALFGPRPARFYFFEELDNGIHPTRLHLLLQLIEQRVKDGRIQMVATTHSPQLLGFLSKRAREAAVLVYRHEGEVEARIRRILDIPDAERVLKERNMSRLHESGWLENAVAFLHNQQAVE